MNNAMISDMTERVYGPEEQPKSATLKQQLLGRVLRVLLKFLIVSYRNALAFRITFF